MIKVILIFCCLHLSIPIFAQENPMFYKEIQLNNKPYSLESLTKEIQQQTGITFSYNAGKVNAKKRIRIKKTRITLEQLLPLIKKHSGIDYKIINQKHIIYTISKSKTRKSNVVKKSTKAETKTKVPIPDFKTNSLREEPILVKSKPEDTLLLPIPITVIGDSTIAASYYSSGGGGNMGGADIIMTRKLPKENAWEDPFASLNLPSDKAKFGLMNFNDYDLGSFFKRRTLLESGFSSDEIYYFNPSVNFGFTFLYGTLSYNIGKYPHPRYGLGTEVKINEHYSFRISFNTGKFLYNESSYSYLDTLIIPPPDSISEPETIIEKHTSAITIQSKLNRLDLTFVWKKNNRFSISGGATLNHLKTNYFSNDLPFSFNSLPYPILDADNRYRTIKPPYVFSNTHDNANSSNIKMWIGIHFSLLYRIPLFNNN